MTYVLMGILILGITLSALWGIKYNPNKDSFMSIEDTTFLRGFWCIIVLLVHVPEAYQNKVQDMLGSFAYIGVTFFFMTSAYGLKYSMKKKVGYLDHFWRKRLPPLIIPTLFANGYQALIYGLDGGTITLLSFLDINGWVKVLLLFYVFFWIVYRIMPKFIPEGHWQDGVMCCIVCGCSIISRLSDLKITLIWTVEPLGFAYGIMAASYSAQIKNWIQEKWKVKCVALLMTAMILGIIYGRLKPIAFGGDYMIKAVLGISIMAFIFTVLAKIKIGNKINGFLADISYEVYLLHGAVFVMLANIKPLITNSGVFIVASVAITVFWAWIFRMISRPMISMLTSAK